MSLGLDDKLNILHRSPLDQLPAIDPESNDMGPELATWVPSRFNIHATDEEGCLLVWNSFSGAISVFPVEQRDEIKSLLTNRQGTEARAEGLIEYLQRRGFLVKQGTDELRRFQLAFGLQYYRNYRSDYLELMLLSSEDCNFRCEYCYENFARGTMQPWVRDSLKKFLTKQFDAGLKNLGVGWFGGEPLYGFEAIEDLGSFFQRESEERGIEYGAGLTTNGYLLTPDVVDKLLSWGTNYIQVTVDGSPEDHDRLRHTRTGEGSFSVIFDNLKKMAQRDDSFTLTIRINFDPESHGRLKEFIKVLGAEFGDDPRFKVLLRPVGRWGGPKDEGVRVCGVEEREMVVETLTEQIKENGFDNFDDLRASGRFGSLVCYASKPNHFIVGASGKLMKCSLALDTHEANVVGKVTRDGEFELDLDKLSFWTEPLFMTTSRCRKCVVLPVCQSLSCPHDRLKNGRLSCPPLRKNAKKRLLWTQKATKKKKASKQVRVKYERNVASVA